MRNLVQLLAIGWLAACALPNHADRWPDRLGFSAGPQPGYAIKRVVEKQEPFTLVADDDSACRTSRERFTYTSVGDWIDCGWSIPAADSAQTARAGA